MPLPIPPRKTSSMYNKHPEKLQRRTSSASLKLAPLIDRFEGLDAVSVPSSRPDLLPAPLQIPRRRPRTAVDEQNKLSTILSSPDIQHVNLDSSYAATSQTHENPVHEISLQEASPDADKPSKMAQESNWQVNQETVGIISPEVVSESKRSGSPQAYASKVVDRSRMETFGTVFPRASSSEEPRKSNTSRGDTDVTKSGTTEKRVDSLSLRDKIKFFDKAVRSISSNLKEPPLAMTPLIPVTPKKQNNTAPITPGSKERARFVDSPTSPTKSYGPGSLKKPTPPFTTEKLVVPTTALAVHNLPSPTKYPKNMNASKYTQSPPKVKLSDVYTDNSHLILPVKIKTNDSQLPAPGRQIARKDKGFSDTTTDWIPAKPHLGSLKPSLSARKRPLPGNNTIALGSEYPLTHEIPRRTSDDAEAIYRKISEETYRKKHQNQTSNLDGNGSRNPSKTDAPVEEPPKDTAAVKPAGKVSLKIAALRRLFDGGSHSKSETLRAGSTALKTSGLRDRYKARNTEFEQPSVAVPHRPAPQNAASGFLRTTTTKEMETSNTLPNKAPPAVVVTAPATLDGATRQRSVNEAPIRRKSKIGDRIKLFESISHGKQKIERRIRRSGGSSTKTTGGRSIFKRESRGLTYTELNEVIGDFSSLDHPESTKGKKRSLAGMWSEIKPTRGGSKEKVNDSNEEERTDLIVKQAQCGLREPKPLRLTEMKKVVDMCKIGSRNASGGSETTLAGGGSTNGGSTRNKRGGFVRDFSKSSRDTLRSLALRFEENARDTVRGHP